MTARAIALFEFDERREFVRWSIAAAIVLAAHFGLAASYLLLRDAQTDGMPAAPVVIVDLAPLPVAPSSDNDIALGPQMREAPQPPEPATQVQPDQFTPPPPVQNPAVATPELPPRPQLDSKPPAPRTSAPARSQSHTGNIAAAPAPGTTSAHSFPPSWISLLFSHLLRYRQYPSAAQANRQEGVVTLTFTMDRNGHVLSRYVAHSSGFPALDAEALAMIERAQPLPSFPSNMGDAARSFTAPIKFSLH